MKRVGLFLGLLGLTGFLWTASLWNQQLESLSRLADPSNGRIYPRNIHGVVVYQTARERDHLELVQNGSIVLFIASLLVSVVSARRY